MQYLARAESVARWSVFLLFLLVPIFFVPAPWMSIVQSKILLATIIVTVGFLAWVVNTLDTSRLRFPKSPLLIAAALIPIAYLISAIATGASWASFVGDGRGQDTVVGFVLLYLAFLIAASILGGSRTTTALRLLLTSSFVLIVVQIVHIAFPAFTFGGALSVPAASIIGSWHDLGIFLALIVFFALSLVRASIFEGFWKYTALATAITALALLVLINFSDVWLGLLGVSIFAILFPSRYALRSVFSSLREKKWWIACALIAVGMYFGGGVVQSILPAPLQVLQVEVRPSWQGTFAVGQQVFAEPTQIFFGSGPNSFLREWGIHKPLSVNETEFWNTDFYYGVGFIPTSLVATGVIGLLAWGAVLMALLWSLYRVFRERSENMVHATLIGAALFLTIFHILYVPGPTLSIFAFLIFGLLVAHERTVEPAREWNVSLAWETLRGKFLTVALVLTGIAIFIGGLQGVRSLVSDAFVNRAVVEYGQSQDLEKTTRSIGWALGILPQNDRAHRAGVELGILQLSQLAASGDTSEATQEELQNTLRATIEHGLSAISIEDQNYQNWLTLARLYGELAGVGVEGAELQAREAYATAIERNPSSPLAYLGIAQLELTKGNDQAARENLESALRVKQSFAPAHFLLSQVHGRAGNFPKAQEHALAVVQIAPQDPLGWYNLGTVLYVQNNYTDAAVAFEQAVALQNNYANALFFLGLSYERLGRAEDALKILESVAVLNPENETLRGIVEQIERGESLDSSFE